MTAPAGYDPQPPIPSGNVIPIRRKSSQLVKPTLDRNLGTTVDAYQEFLSRQRNLSPAEAPALFQGLVPSDEDIAHLPEAAPSGGMAPAWRGKGDGYTMDDPTEDANGRRRRRVQPEDE